MGLVVEVLVRYNYFFSLARSAAIKRAKIGACPLSERCKSAMYLVVVVSLIPLFIVLSVSLLTFRDSLVCYS